MKCIYCGKEMGSDSDNGCSVTYFRFIPGKEYLEFLKSQSYSDDRMRTVIAQRVKVGAINDMYTSDEYKKMGRDRCPDCGAPVGSYHHEGCDNERCPKCGGQFISCDCDDSYDIETIDDN